MAERTTLRVELDGNFYSLVSTTGEKRLQQTADLVAEKIKEVRKQNPKYPSARLAMLVALQMAEDYLNLQDEYLALLEEAEINATLPPPRLEVMTKDTGKKPKAKAKSE